jgi:hypothetical protein
MGAPTFLRMSAVHESVKYSRNVDSEKCRKRMTKRHVKKSLLRMSAVHESMKYSPNVDSLLGGFYAPNIR